MSKILDFSHNLTENTENFCWNWQKLLNFSTNTEIFTEKPTENSTFSYLKSRKMSKNPRFSRYSHGKYWKFQLKLAKMQIFSSKTEIFAQKSTENSNFPNLKSLKKSKILDFSHNLTENTENFCWNWQKLRFLLKNPPKIPIFRI